MREVTDPSILAELEETPSILGLKPVTDPTLINELEGIPSVKEKLSISFDMPLTMDELNKLGSMAPGIDMERGKKAFSDAKTLSKMTGQNISPSLTYKMGDTIDEWLTQNNNSVPLKPEDNWLQIGKKAIESVPYAVGVGIGGNIRMVEDFLASSVPPDMRKIIEENKDLLKDYTGPIPFKPTTIGDQTADFWNKRLEETAPDAAPDSLKRYAYLITSNVAQNLPALLASVLTGNPELALNYMLLQAQGQKYQQLREKGTSFEIAAPMAAIAGLSEKYTEYLPTDALIKTGVPFAKRLLLVSGLDVPGELINTAVESAIDKVTITPDMTIDDIIGALTETAIVSLGSAGLLTTIIHPVVHAREQQEKRLNIEQGKGDTDFKKVDDSLKQEAEINTTIEEAGKAAIEKEITPEPIEEAVPVSEAEISKIEPTEEAETDAMLDLIAEGRDIKTLTDEELDNRLIQQAEEAEAPADLRIENIPEKLEIEIMAMKAKTGEKIKIKGNAREAFTENQDSLKKYQSLLDCLGV